MACRIVHRSVLARNGSAPSRRKRRFEMRRSSTCATINPRRLHDRGGSRCRRCRTGRSFAGAIMFDANRAGRCALRRCRRASSTSAWRAVPGAQAPQGRARPWTTSTTPRRRAGSAAAEPRRRACGPSFSPGRFSSAIFLLLLVRRPSPPRARGAARRAGGTHTTHTHACGQLRLLITRWLALRPHRVLQVQCRRTPSPPPSCVPCRLSTSLTAAM